MTDAQTEARAIALDVYNDAVDSDDGSHSMDMNVATDIIAAALAAKNAELAAVKVSNNKWLAKWERAEARLAEANKALEEAEDTLRLCERPASPDPQHHDEVKALGRRIGFGALMSTASAGWREVLASNGDPVGGEFVAGPCHSTVLSALTVIRAARRALTGGKNG